MLQYSLLSVFEACSRTCMQMAGQEITVTFLRLEGGTAGQSLGYLQIWVTLPNELRKLLLIHLPHLQPGALALTVLPKYLQKGFYWALAEHVAADSQGTQLCFDLFQNPKNEF